VVALSDQLKMLAGKSLWVMASDTESGHYNDKALSKAMRRLFALKSPDPDPETDKKTMPLLPIPTATPHDLRRTLRTQMGEVLKVEPHICERCLNHSLGKLTQTYDTGAYLEQRREAIERWADQVDLYVSQHDNVVILSKEAS